MSAIENNLIDERTYSNALKIEMKEKNETMESMKRISRIDKKKLTILTAIDERNEKTLNENRLLIDKQELAIKNLKERITKKNFYMKKQRENLLKYSLNQSQISNKLAEILFYVRAVVHTVNPNILLPFGTVSVLVEKGKVIEEAIVPIRNEDNIDIDNREGKEVQNENDTMIEREKMENKEESNHELFFQENVSQEHCKIARVTALQGKASHHLLCNHYRHYSNYYYYYYYYY